MQGERWIEYVRLADVQPAPDNPKAHDDAGIRSSLTRLGVIEPVLMDDRTGRLLAGHGRLDALRAAHAEGTPPEGVTVDDDGEWLIPVVRGWASKDDTEASAALVAVNALVERGGWALDELSVMLEDIGRDALGGTGWAPDDLDAMLADLHAPEREQVESSRSERLARYTEKQSRSIVLDYNGETFQRVTDMAERARKDLHLASNADLFAALLGIA